MSKSNLRFRYDRPAPEPHFIPGYTGHCPSLADQIGITYPLATYLILQGRPDVANILSDIRPAVNKYESRKEHSFKQGYKFGESKNKGKSGQRKKWETEDGQKERGKLKQESSSYRCGSGIHNRPPYLEVDIAFGKNMKKESYECGSNEHKHLFLKGDMTCGNKHAGSNHSEGRSHSDGDNSLRKQESVLQDKFIEAQKEIFCKIVSEVEKEKLKDTHPPCCNSLRGYRKMHCC